MSLFGHAQFAMVQIRPGPKGALSVSRIANAANPEWYPTPGKGLIPSTLARFGASSRKRCTWFAVDCLCNMLWSTQVAFTTLLKCWGSTGIFEWKTLRRAASTPKAFSTILRALLNDRWTIVCPAQYACRGRGEVGFVEEGTLRLQKLHTAMSHHVRNPAMLHAAGSWSHSLRIFDRKQNVKKHPLTVTPNRASIDGNKL